MKHRMPLKYIIAAIAVPVLIAVGSVVFVTTQQSNQPAQSVAQPLYMLKSYQGKIAVFLYGSDEPTDVFDVYVSTLPEVDQLSLNNGIPVATQQELARLIEDFTS